MQTIYKYPLALQPEQDIKLPLGAEILHFGVEDNRLTIWAEVSSDQEPNQPMRFAIIGTGQQVPDAGRYIGTVLMQDTVDGQDKTFVWHLYDVTQ